MECTFCKKACEVKRGGSDIAIFRCTNCSGCCDIIFVEENQSLATTIFSYQENERDWILSLDTTENSTRLSYISLLSREEDRQAKLLLNLSYTMKDVTPQNVHKTINRLNSMMAFS